MAILLSLNDKIKLIVSLLAENKFKINLKILPEMVVINNLNFKKKKKVWVLLVIVIEKVYQDPQDKAKNKKVGQGIQAETSIVQLKLRMLWILQKKLKAMKFSLKKSMQLMKSEKME